MKISYQNFVEYRESSTQKGLIAFIILGEERSRIDRVVTLAKQKKKNKLSQLNRKKSSVQDGGEERMCLCAPPILQKRKITASC